MAKHKHKWQDVLIEVDEHLSHEKYCTVCGKIKFNAREFVNNLLTYDEDKRTLRKYTSTELHMKYPNIKTIHLGNNFDFTKLPDEELKALKKERRR